jgi:hypothetical protein
MYNATGEIGYLRTAEQVAQDAVDKLYANDLFRGHPAKPYYETTNGVGVLLDALLDLDEVSTVRPVVKNTFQQVVEPTTDVWIREIEPGATYEHDELSVWGTHSGSSDGRRYALIEFDVGQLKGNLRGARLDLFASDYVRNSTAFAQQAVLLVPTDVANATWGNYAAYGEVPLESLGGLRFEDDGVETNRYWTSTASEADLVTLGNYLRQTGGKVAIALKPVEMHRYDVVPNGRREWADADSYVAEDSLPRPPKLVLNGGDIVLTPTADGWVREKDSDAFYEHDLVSVWANPPDTYDPNVYGQRYGLLGFDLSGVDVPITDAVLELYAKNGSALHNDTAFEQFAYLLNTDSITDITWDSYANLNESAFESLGHYLLDADSPSGQYYESGSASGLDLVLLNAFRLGDGFLAMSLKAPLADLVTRDDYYCGERDWSDMEDAESPRLVFTVEAIPGDANLDGTVNDADASILGSNWRQSDRGWSQGDFNYDGMVDDQDAAILAAHWHVTANSAEVPEPSAAALLLAGLASLLAWRRRG